MNIHNEIDNDVRTVRVSELQDLLGDGNEPSTRAPLKIPAGIYMPRVRAPKRGGCSWQEREERRHENRRRNKYSVIDRLFAESANTSVRDLRTLDEHQWSLDEEGSYDPEDDLIDAIDAQNNGCAADEPADISRTWKEREQWLTDHGWSWDDLDLFLYTWRHVWVSDFSKGHPYYEDFGYYQSIRHAERNWLYLLMEDEMADVLASTADEEASEARMLSREQNRFTRKSVSILERAQDPDNKRQRNRRKGVQSLRSMQFEIADKITHTILENELEFDRVYGHEAEDAANEARCLKYEAHERTQQLKHCLDHEGSSAYSPPYNAEVDWMVYWDDVNAA